MIHTSLLQTAARQSKSSPEAASLLQVDQDAEVGDPPSLSAMETYVHSQALRVLAGEDPDFQFAVLAIREFVEMVVNGTLDSHKTDQEEIDASLQLMSECSPDVNVLLQAAGGKRTAHTVCREEEVTKRSEHDQACDTYHASRKSTYANPPTCSLAHVNTENQAELKQFESCLDKFHVWHGIHPLYTACRSAEEVHHNQTALCDGMQSAFEISYCEFASAQATFCKCRKDHTEFLQTMRDASEHKVSSRKADFRAAKRIDCMLDVIAVAANGTNGNKTILLDECKDESFNVTHLDVRFGSIPETDVDCNPVALPCGAAWLRTEYEGKAWQASGSCKTCEVPSFAPAPAVDVVPRDALELELLASDVDGQSWPSAAGEKKAVLTGAAGAAAIDGIAAVNLRDRGDVARIDGLNIGPRAMPQLTIEMWIYMHSKSGSYGWASGPDEGGGYDRSLVLYDPRFNGISVMHGGSTGWGSGVRMPLQTWTHIVGTWEQNGEAYVYVNGGRYGPHTARNSEQGTYFVIGNRFQDDSTYNVDISVAVARVWSRVLAPVEVTKLHEMGLPGQ